MNYRHVVWTDICAQRRCRVVPTSKSSTPLCPTQIAVPACCMALPITGDYIPPNCPMTASGELRLVSDGSRVYQLDDATTLEMGTLEFPVGQPSDSCPRTVLRRALKVAKDEMDLVIGCGFEVEFQLYEHHDHAGPEEGLPIRPVDGTMYGCTRALSPRVEAVLREIVEKLFELGISVLQYHPESASGQFELSLGFKEALEAADDLQAAREVIVRVAKRHDLEALFVPKTNDQQAGNGSHCHLSIHAADGTMTNKFGGTNEFGLSEEGEQFMAGVLHELSNLMAVTVPSVNSLRRVGPGCWTGSHQSWGIDNKEAPIRLVSPPRGGVCHPSNRPTNFEYKLLDASANIYLAVAGLVAAGLEGMRQKRKLPEPLQQSVPRKTQMEMFKALPTSMEEMLKQFRGSKVMSNCFGETLVGAIVAVREEEARKFPGNASSDVEDQVKLLFDKY